MWPVLACSRLPFAPVSDLKLELGNLAGTAVVLLAGDLVGLNAWLGVDLRVSTPLAVNGWNRYC